MLMSAIAQSALPTLVERPECRSLAASSKGSRSTGALPNSKGGFSRFVGATPSFRCVATSVEAEKTKRARPGQPGADPTACWSSISTQLGTGSCCSSSSSSSSKSDDSKDHVALPRLSVRSPPMGVAAEQEGSATMAPVPTPVVVPPPEDLTSGNTIFSSKVALGTSASCPSLLPTLPGSDRVGGSAGGSNNSNNFSSSSSGSRFGAVPDTTANDGFHLPSMPRKKKQQRGGLILQACRGDVEPQFCELTMDDIIRARGDRLSGDPNASKKNSKKSTKIAPDVSNKVGSKSSCASDATTATTSSSNSSSTTATATTSSSSSSSSYASASLSSSPFSSPVASNTEGKSGEECMFSSSSPSTAATATTAATAAATTTTATTTTTAFPRAPPRTQMQQQISSILGRVRANTARTEAEEQQQQDRQQEREEKQEEQEEEGRATTHKAQEKEEENEEEKGEVLRPPEEKKEADQQERQKQKQQHEEQQEQQQKQQEQQKQQQQQEQQQQQQQTPQQKQEEQEGASSRPGASTKKRLSESSSCGDVGAGVATSSATSGLAEAMLGRSALAGAVMKLSSTKKKVTIEGEGGMCQTSSKDSSAGKRPAMQHSMSLRSLGRLQAFRVRVQAKKGLEDVELRMPETVLELRQNLSEKFLSNLRRAYKALDSCNAGTITYQRLKDYYVDGGVFEFDDKVSTRQLFKLCKEMDSSASGMLSFADFAGDFPLPPADENEDWSYLTTDEKVYRYCEKAVQETSPQFRPPVWATQYEAHDTAKYDEEKHSREIHRMKTMMAQGLHKTKQGLRQTAPHLIRQNVDVRDYRREALESVEMSSKRIRHAIQQSARTRHDLQACCQELRKMEQISKFARQSQKAAQKHDRVKKGSSFNLSSILSLDMFDSDDSADESDASSNEGNRGEKGDSKSQEKLESSPNLDFKGSAGLTRKASLKGKLGSSTTTMRRASKEIA